MKESDTNVQYYFFFNYDSLRLTHFSTFFHFFESSPKLWAGKKIIRIFFQLRFVHYSTKGVYFHILSESWRWRGTFLVFMSFWFGIVHGLSLVRHRWKACLFSCPSTFFLKNNKIPLLSICTDNYFQRTVWLFRQCHGVDMQNDLNAMSSTWIQFDGGQCWK